jgi:hypothetical protein
MAKVKSDRDLVDSGIRALVEALGYQWSRAVAAPFF